MSVSLQELEEVLRVEALHLRNQRRGEGIHASDRKRVQGLLTLNTGIFNLLELYRGFGALEDLMENPCR
jgi:ABC-type histidine transport system ATPase subunit